MKKIMAITLVAVFALSAMGTVFATKAETMPLCKATCDMDTYLWYICCPYLKNPNSQHIFWDCYYGDQCYFPEQ